MAATKHTHADTDATRYRVPPEPNRWPAIGLAVGVHALLLAFLFIGVSWQNNVPVAVEAEIWDVQTQVAAPPPPPPPPEPEPEPQPETPPPQPAPRAVEPPPPPPVERPAPPKQPDIALEREKKRQEELKRKEEARAEREREQERERAEQQRADEKKAKDLAAKKERDLAEKKERDAAEKKERAAAEKKEREAAEKKEAEQKKKDEADKKKKAEAEKKKQEAADQKRRDDARAVEMKRLMAGAGAGTAGSTGTAAQTTAPGRDKGYVAAITAKVKGNTSYAGDLDEPGNPTATFKVEQLPTGEIISVRKTKSSGIPAFDEAVEKGITKSSPLPKKKDGTVERSLEINFRMKDMQ